MLPIVGPPDHECIAPEPVARRLRGLGWPLAACRELDDALLLLRSNWPGIDSILLRTEGDPLAVASADVALTSGYERDWFVQEVVHYWKRTLKRIDLAWQSVIALVEPGSCFVGTLLEANVPTIVWVRRPALLPWISRSRPMSAVRPNATNSSTICRGP